MSAPNTKGTNDGSFERDLIAQDSPTLSLPLEARKQMRAAAGIDDPELLDSIYGPDSK